MSLPKTISTIELQSLTGVSKSGVTKFEQQGAIKRSAVNEWPMPDTLVALVTHLRERKPVVSNERQNFERARAQREQMKAELMMGTLCRTSDFHEAWDALILYMVAGLVAIPARCTRDLALRKTIQAELNSWRSNVADEFKRRAAELGGGEAA